MNESNEAAVSRRRFLVKSSAAAIAAGLTAPPADSNVFAQAENDKNKPPKIDTQDAGRAAAPRRIRDAKISCAAEPEI